MNSLLVTAITLALAGTAPAAGPNHATEFHARAITLAGALELPLAPDAPTAIPLPKPMADAGWKCAILSPTEHEKTVARSVACVHKNDAMMGSTAICYKNENDYDHQRFSLTAAGVLVTVDVVCATSTLDTQRF